MDITGIVLNSCCQGVTSHHHRRLGWSVGDWNCCGCCCWRRGGGAGGGGGGGGGGKGGGGKGGGGRGVFFKLNIF